MQLQPVCGRLFILSYLVITCFKKVKSETSVRCAGDAPFEQLQHILILHYSFYTTDIIRELRQLLIDLPTYFNNW